MKHTDYLKLIGSKGGRATKKKYGPEYYVEKGKLSGAARRKKKLEQSESSVVITQPENNT